MPLNRVNPVKAMSMWLMVLNATNEDTDLEPPEPSQNESVTWSKKLSIFFFGTKKKLTRYDMNAKRWVPGMLIVTMPEAGVLLGYLDIGYWAAFLYVLGSLFYVIDSFFLMSTVDPSATDDASSPANVFNLLAVWVFVVNALACFLDWHTQVKQLSMMNIDMDDKITGGFQVNEINHNITWCYFFNNFFFLGAAVVFLIQGLWMESPTLDLLNCSTGFCGNFWINFWGNFLYVLSSVFAVAEYFEDKRTRERDHLPSLKLFTTDWDLFDWFGWGDWLYLITSTVACIQSFFMFNPNITDDDSSGYYLLANTLFLFDSLAYFIGYVIYLYNLRNALLTGTVPIAQTGAISEMIGDNFDEADEEDERYSNVQLLGTARQSLLPFDKKGTVSLADIRAKLTQARSVRIRRTEAALMLQNIPKPPHSSPRSDALPAVSGTQNNVENPLFRATFAESTDLELSKIKKHSSKRFSKEV